MLTLPAITGGETAKRLLQLLGLDPERTTSFKVWAEGPNDFLHLEWTGYAPEHAKPVDIKDVMKTSFSMKT